MQLTYKWFFELLRNAIFNFPRYRGKMSMMIVMTDRDMNYEKAKRSSQMRRCSLHHWERQRKSQTSAVVRRDPDILAAISSWRIKSEITGVHYATFRVKFVELSRLLAIVLDGLQRRSFRAALRRHTSKHGTRRSKEDHRMADDYRIRRTIVLRAIEGSNDINKPRESRSRTTIIARAKTKLCIGKR